MAMTRLERRAKHARRRILSDATPLEDMLFRQMQLSRPADAALFARQVRLVPYLCDFVAPALRLVVEIDGAQHDAPLQNARDSKRDAALEARGYRVLRFANAVVRADPAGVLDTIGAVVEERRTLPPADPDLPAPRPGKPRPRPARR